MKTINLPEGNAFGVDDDGGGTPYVNYAEQRAKTLFFVWVSLTEHRWVILGLFRTFDAAGRPNNSACECFKLWGQWQLPRAIRNPFYRTLAF
jgi:hypothetical protein